MQNMLGLLILQGKHNVHWMSNQSPEIFFSFLYANVGCLGNTITFFFFGRNFVTW
jgi:hypothetical protein